MNNANLLADLFIAAAAIATPLFTTISPTEASGMRAALAPRHEEVTKAVKTRKVVARALTYTVTATVYQAVPGQTDAEPFVTADNSRIKPHYGSKKRWMALSRDLLKPWGGPFKFGDKVRVMGISSKLDGVYTIHDTMNRRHRHCMDVLTHPSEKIDVFQKGVKIQRLAAL